MVRKQDFFLASNEGFPHPDLKILHDLIMDPSLHIIIDSNSNVREMMTTFLGSLSTAPNYLIFYPSHPTRHFLQRGDYLKTENRPQIQIPAVTVFENWSEYITVTGYGCFYETKTTTTDQLIANLENQIFKLRVMNVPHSKERYYLRF